MHKALRKIERQPRFAIDFGPYVCLLLAVFTALTFAADGADSECLRDVSNASRAATVVGDNIARQSGIIRGGSGKVTPVESALDVGPPARRRPANTDDVPTVIAAKAQGTPPQSRPKVADRFTASPLVRELMESGYTDFKFIGSGGMGLVFGGKKDGKTYLFKEANADVSPAALAVEFHYGRMLEEEYRKKIAAAKAEGRAIPPFYFPEAMRFVRAEGFTPAHLEMKLYPKNRDPNSPDHFVRAPSLRERMNDGTLTPETEEKIVRSTVEAVYQLSQAKIVHYDLKPENILIDDDGNIKIIDFGLSADVGRRPKMGGVAQGDVAGTPAYMSLNQLRGNPAQNSDDVFSLGVTLTEVFAHREVNRSGEPDHVPENGYRRSLNHLNPQKPPYFVSYDRPPALANRALAIAVYNYRDRGINEYRQGIKNALELSEADFISAYGKQLRAGFAKPDATPAEQSAAAMKIAKNILGSPVLISHYPEGLGFTPAQRREVELVVERLREETKSYYDENGNSKKDPISAYEKNPYFDFKDFTQRLKSLEPPPKPRG